MSKENKKGSRENRIGLLLFAIGIFGILGGIMGYSGLWAISWLVGPGYIMMTS